MGMIVNASKLAEIIGVTSRTISTWRREGMPIREEAGRQTLFDSSEAIQWLLGRETSGGDPETIAARRRIACAEAGRRELRLSRERGESVPLALVGPVWQRATGAFRSRMLALPRTAVPRLRRSPGDAAREKVLTELVHEALNDLAATDYGKIVHAVVKEGAGENNMAAKGADPEGGTKNG